MPISITKLIYILALAAAATITGCGGSSGGGGGGGGGGGVTYSGSTSPAAIGATNAEAIGTTATEGVQQAIQTDATPLPFGIVVSDDATPPVTQKLREISRHVLDNLQENPTLPAGITLSGDFFSDDPTYCGGSVTVPDSALTSNSSTFNGTITFSNFCTDAGPGFGKMYVNGSMTLSMTSTSSSTTYNNLTVSFNGETYALNGSSVCDSLGNNCSMSSDYAGSDGSTYRMSDVSVSGNDSSGYTVDASFCHPSYGCVTIVTTTPITFGNCANGMPDSGAISFTGASGSSGTISFSSCSGYSGTYDNGNGSVVSFGGSWPTT